MDLIQTLETIDPVECKEYVIFHWNEMFVSNLIEPFDEHQVSYSL